ncbi:MAG TPA: NUDIX domain-containing protein [Patescibacteria group bacterium]|nr:NUDIX domain-containing protein [Patescibacteria group bacterium]
MTKLDKAQTTPNAKIISQERVFDGYHKLDVVKVQPRSLKHGGWAEPMEREVMMVKDIAVVLLYIPETDEVLLNQQFRVGALIAGVEDPFLFECAAGAVDEGEKPEAAARREAFEETGCDITDIEYIGTAYSSPGCMAEQFFLYVGRIAKAEMGIYGHEEEGEEIKTHLLPWKHVRDMLDKGAIANITAGYVLQWFARNHERIRNQWLNK